MPKGRRRTEDVPYRITFTPKPKGFRINASLVRKMKELGVSSVRVGLTNNDQTFIVQPCETTDDIPKVVYGLSGSAQVTFSAVGIWAENKGLARVPVDGLYNEETKRFEFDLSPHLKKESGEDEGV